MPTEEEVAAQAAAKEAQAAKDAEAAQAAAEAKRLADEKAAKDNLSADELKALLDKSNKDRSSANKEAVEAKKRADALAAKVKKYEDEKKTEAEKLEARAKEAEAEAAAAKEEAKSLKHRGYAQDAGVLPQYREFAVSEFAKAEDADPAEWFKEFKESHPAMFNGKPPATPTAKGPPSAPTATTETAKAIEQIEADLKADPRRRDAFELKRRLADLKKQKKE